MEQAEAERIEELSLSAEAHCPVDEEGSFQLGVEGFGVVAKPVEPGEVLFSFGDDAYGVGEPVVFIFGFAVRGYPCQEWLVRAGHVIGDVEVESADCAAAAFDLFSGQPVEYDRGSSLVESDLADGAVDCGKLMETAVTAVRFVRPGAERVPPWSGVLFAAPLGCDGLSALVGPVLAPPMGWGLLVGVGAGGDVEHVEDERL